MIEVATYSGFLLKVMETCSLLSLNQIFSCQLFIFLKAGLYLQLSYLTLTYSSMACMAVWWTALIWSPSSAAPNSSERSLTCELRSKLRYCFIFRFIYRYFNHSLAHHIKCVIPKPGVLSLLNDLIVKLSSLRHGVSHAMFLLDIPVNPPAHP